MPSPFLTDFDSLWANILTDYRNRFPEADTSQGSLIFIKSAVLAGAVWGLHRRMDWVGRQIFADTADSANMEHWANIFGLTRRTDETDAELLDRLLSTLRTPPAGGNAGDYVAWALEVDGVKAAYCVPEGQGPGTVDVVILASGESETPGEALLEAVWNHIDPLRPVTASVVRVLAPTVTTQAVTMEVTGDVDLTVLADEIEAYLNAMEPGADLKISQLTALAINAGADDVDITTPSANVPVTDAEMIRAGVVTVTEVA